MSRSVKLEKRGKNYFARYYDPSRPRGKQRCRRTLKTHRKDVAERKIVAKRKAFEKGEWSPWDSPSGPEPLTLHEAVQRFLRDKEESVRASTAKQYRHKLEHFTHSYTPAGLMLADVGEKHVRAYVHGANRDSKKGPLKPSTKAMRFRHVRVLFNWLVKQGHLDQSPLDGMDKPKAGKQQAAFLKPEDVAKLLMAIDAHAALLDGEPGPQPDDAWLKDMIVVGIGTGLRRAELLALRWRDIDLEGEMLYVRNRDGFTTKSGDERPVPLAGDALERLMQMREARQPDPSDPVFITSKDAPPKPDRVSKRFKFFVEKAKLPDRDRISFHNLRHSTASWLAMKGVPMRVIQSILGHSTIQVTERYSHLSPDVLGAAMRETFG